MPKYSIVTVCFNALEDLKKTIKNIRGQTYSDWEIIVIDGASTDGTLDYLQSVLDKRIRYISEPDKGIFDAMNKGIKRSKGNYIIFMNAGDTYVDDNILHDIDDKIDSDSKIIYYGASQRIFSDGRVRSQLFFNQFNEKFPTFEGIMPNHQSMVSTRDCFENNMFDCRYTIASDFAWYVSCKKRGYKFVDLNIVSVNFNINGLSQRVSSREKIFEQKNNILCFYYPVLYRLYKLWKLK